MKSKALSEVLERVKNWPPHWQDELAQIARDIDEAVRAGDYEPGAAEFAGIDRGLRDAAEGRYATPEQVEAALTKLQRA